MRPVRLKLRGGSQASVAKRDESRRCLFPDGARLRMPRWSEVEERSEFNFVECTPDDWSSCPPACVRASANTRAYTRAGVCIRVRTRELSSVRGNSTRMRLRDTWVYAITILTRMCNSLFVRGSKRVPFDVYNFNYKSFHRFARLSLITVRIVNHWKRRSSRAD